MFSVDRHESRGRANGARHCEREGEFVASNLQISARLFRSEGRYAVVEADNDVVVIGKSATLFEETVQMVELSKALAKPRKLCC